MKEDNKMLHVDESNIVLDNHLNLEEKYNKIEKQEISNKFDICNKLENHVFTNRTLNIINCLDKCKNNISNNLINKKNFELIKKLANHFNNEITSFFG